MVPLRRKSLALTSKVDTCAHLDHNPANLASLCPRCHLRHDRQQHLQSARRNRRRRWAIRDLFD